MGVLTVLIVFFPLLGFLILSAAFRTIPHRITSIISPGVILVSFCLSLLLFFLTQNQRPVQTVTLFHWIAAGSLQVSFSFLVDPLSILMLLVVTGVGFIIHVYSIGYMKRDPGFNRFFAYMNLFIFFMLILILGANYPIMFIGWEGVGLCSYLLIGFWFRNREYGNAAKKAFIMNRIGDMGFLLAIFLIFITFGSTDYLVVFTRAGTIPAGNVTLMAITLLLFAGAVGKSAQIPLHTWLPDAMAGPTPVSALIHAATMVTAGVYMIARSSGLYALSPVSMAVVAGTGLATALLTASIAMTQNDIKKILAYSTISQIGFMILSLGVGSFASAMFHLTTHAFFKALLFLAAGSLIHALNGEQDIRNMGGLRGRLTWTYWTFLAGTLAISGIPPFSGFFSKDEILSHVWTAHPWLWILAATGSLMTAYYMFRLFYVTFHGVYRGTIQSGHPVHESPPVMMIPMLILAFLSITGGILNLPGLFGGGQWLERYLAPAFFHAKAYSETTHIVLRSTEWLLMSVTIAGILLLVFLSWFLYGKPWIGKSAIVPDQDDASRGFLARLFFHKFYIDELYEKIIVQPVLQLSRVLHRYAEIRLIDRLVNLTGIAVVRAGTLLRYIQTGNVGYYLFYMIIGIILILLLNTLI